MPRPPTRPAELPDSTSVETKDQDKRPKRPVSAALLCYIVYVRAGEANVEKRVCGCCLTSNVTVFRVAPSVGDRSGASRRKIDLGVDGWTSAAAMPPSRQAGCSIARSLDHSRIFEKKSLALAGMYPRKKTSMDSA